MQAVARVLAPLVGSLGGLLLGCGDNATPPLSAEASSGSRLELVRHVYPDGTAQWETGVFHDADRDERCTPTRWSDGFTYCTPPADDLGYTSATCTTALGRVTRTGPEVPRYFVRPYWLGTERPPSSLYRRGASTVAPAAIWLMIEGTCQGPFDSAGAEYYELGDEVLQGDLVRIKRTEIAAGPRLALAVQTSDDGLRVPTTIHDLVLAEDCVAEDRPNAATTSCRPEHPAVVTYFRDAACTEIAIAVAGTDPTPEIATRFSEETGCATYYKVGAEVPTWPVYLLTGTHCVTAALQGGEHIFQATELAHLATLQRERAAEPEPGRQLASIDVVDGEVRLRDPLLFDRRTGADCVRTAIAGELRCLPATRTRTVAVFRDEHCQLPITVALVAQGTCDPTSPFAWTETRDGPDVHALGAPYDAPLYHVSTGDRCTPHIVPARFVPHAIGPALPHAMFPAAMTTID